MIRLKPIWLVLISALLFLLPNGVLNGLLYLLGKLDPDSLIIYTGIQKIEASILAYSLGSWGDIFSQRLDDWIYMSGYGCNSSDDFIHHCAVFNAWSSSSKGKVNRTCS